MTLFVCIELYVPSEHDIKETKRNEKNVEFNTWKLHVCIFVSKSYMKEMITIIEEKKNENATNEQEKPTTNGIEQWRKVAERN